MDRTERLLDLVALLLDATEPFPWAQLRETFEEDYGAASDDAAERKFERDKAELLELGIPIVYVQGDDERRDGYVVQKEAYYLPEAGLTPEELAVLYAAGSAALASGAFPGRQELAHALRKIGFFAGNEVPTPRVRMDIDTVSTPELPLRLEQLWTAASTRKSVNLTYFSPRNGAVTQRKVDPYGLALRRGLWSLVGFCHLRQGIRTFHVHRIRKAEVNSSKPRSPDFEVPRDFDIDQYVATYPWQHRFHAPIAVEVELSGALSALTKGLLPTAEITARGDRALGTLQATDLEGLVRYILSLGADCRILAPQQAVDRWHALAQVIHETHARPRAGSGGP